jgi:acetyl esterase
MTLDPQAKAILDQLAAAEGPALYDLPPDEARRTYEAMAQVFDTVDIPIGSTSDQLIKGPASDIPVRIYTPIATGGALPILLYFHGGGWVIGNIATHDKLCRALANEAHCIVLSVDYRLAPEAPFPAAVDDCYAALEWAEKNASEIGGDANRIAVGGDSAGGNLAAVLALKARNEKGPEISFQLLIYPVTDARMDTGSYRAFGEGHLLEARTMAWFFDQYAPEGLDREQPYLSPLRAKTLKNLPPAYVVTAGHDVLRDEGKAYADALREAGVEVTHVNYEGMVHGFFNMQAVLDTAKTAIKEAAKAMEKALA